MGRSEIHRIRPGGDLGVIYTNIGGLSDNERYNLLTHPFVLDCNFVFSIVLLIAVAVRGHFSGGG